MNSPSFVEDQEQLYWELGAQLLAMVDGTEHASDWSEVMLTVERVKLPEALLVGVKFSFSIDVTTQGGTRFPFIVRPEMVETVEKLDQLCRKHSTEVWIRVSYRLIFHKDGPTYECHFDYDNTHAEAN